MSNMFDYFIELAKCAGNIGDVTSATFSEKLISFTLVDNNGDTFHLSLLPAVTEGAGNADP
jgi:hypothetical protein